MTVVVVSRDLMDGSRFRAAIPDVVMLREADVDVILAAQLVLLDLAGPFDLAAIVAVGTPVIAYGAHVEAAALDAARAAGCVDAVPRSRIFRRAGELLG